MRTSSGRAQEGAEEQVRRGRGRYDRERVVSVSGWERAARSSEGQPDQPDQPDQIHQDRPEDIVKKGKERLEPVRHREHVRVEKVRKRFGGIW